MIESLHRSRATPPPGTTPSSIACASGGQRVVDQILAFFHRRLGGCADINLGDAAGKFRQPLLQLLAIVVAVGPLDFATNLLGTAIDGRLRAGTLHDRRILGVDLIFLATPRVLHIDALELDSQVLEDRLAAGEDGNVFQHGLPPIAVTRRLHRRDLEDAAELVDDKRGQRLAFDVFRDDQAAERWPWRSFPAAERGPWPS